LFHTDEAWQKLFSYAKDVARVKEIKADVMIFANLGQKSLPQHFQDSIICISTGSREALSTSNQYKINLYFPAIDALLNEFNT